MHEAVQLNDLLPSKIGIPWIMKPQTSVFAKRPPPPANVRFFCRENEHAVVLTFCCTRTRSQCRMLVFKKTNDFGHSKLGSTNSRSFSEGKFNEHVPGFATILFCLISDKDGTKNAWSQSPHQVAKRFPYGLLAPH